MLSRRERGDGGAVGVVAVVTVALLFSMAALAVDLTNGWSRKREVARQADLAALAGGAKLPAPATNGAARLAVATEVLKYFEANWTAERGQAVGNLDGVTTAGLLDGSENNGEITFENNRGTKLKVVAPATTVDFAFAGIMGFKSLDVQASATVEIRSPGTVAPLWLPEGCTSGLQWADAPSGPTTPPAPASTYPVPTPPGQGTFTINSFYTVPPAPLVAGSTPVPMTIRVNDWPGGTTATAVLTLGNMIAGVSDPLTTTVTPAGGARRDVNFFIPPAVTSTPGQYEMWVIAGTPTAKYSVRYADKLVIMGPGSTPPCPRDGGNFHKLDSPRLDTDDPNAHERLARNIALGLDHQLVPFEPVSAIPADGICALGGSIIPFAELDDHPARDERNCIHTETGNSPGGLTEGFITGGTSPAGPYVGRMYSQPTSADCGGRRAPLAYAGRSGANNDSLACFIPAGVSMDEIVNGTRGPVLDQNIYDSPRFLWMPVAADHAFNGTKWEALDGFVAAFITDERCTSDCGSTSTTSGANGIYFDDSDPDDTGGSGGHVKAVAVIAFSSASLPDVPSGPGPSTPYIGAGPKIVKLIDNDLG